MALYWDLKKQKHQLASDYRRNREQYLTASLSLIFIVLILTYFGPFEDLRRFGSLTIKRIFSRAAGPVQLVEAESATFSGPMTTVSDSSASGGSYILSTVNNLNDPTAPAPAAGSSTPTPASTPASEETTTSEAATDATPTPIPTPEPLPIATPSSATTSANLIAAADFSGGAVLQATSVDSGSATFSVNVANSGTYTIWTRIWGNDSSSDSFWLSVDGQPSHNVGDGGFPYNSWQWVNWEDGSPDSKISLNLTVGSHTLTVYGREAGTRLDRILLTADLALVPIGFGELPSPVPTPASTTGGFLETFDGSPSAPERFLPSSKWAVTIHQRDVRFPDFYGMTNTDAHHDATCSPPNLTHPVSEVEDSVFKCKNHVMTAINGIGYTLVYLMPNHMVDFSQGEAVISWDMSTEQSSFDRDWVDLWITPWDDQMRLPHDGRGADLQGGPKNAVHFVSGRFKFDTRIIRNYVLDKDLGGGVGWDTFLVPDRARRDKFELRISRTHLKFCMPAYNKCWVDDDIADLGWDRGVVQFGHHSYNPEKNGELPGTWHWDNVAISPSVPFTMIQANRRYVDKNAPEALGFSAPAPANAYLNFGALGVIDASFDGGNSWQRATKQLGQDQVDGDYQRNIFSSYWMPIPQGASSVLFRQGEWCDLTFCGVWHVRDISIFSQSTTGGGPVPAIASPTPLPVAAVSTSTPTPTPTPTPSPVSTPTPTPVVSPVVTPVATSTPTPTSVATPVATPVAPPIPTPAPTPAPIACAITQASWGTNNAAAGSQVTLNVTGTAGCADQQVSFVVMENDSVLEGVGDDPVKTNPVSINFNGTTATATWTAEYQEDGLLGVFDPPEYYFNAALTSNPTQTLRSADPMLTVPRSATSVPTSTVGFLETFDGSPTAPQSFLQTPASVKWDVTVHDRNPDRWYQLKDMTKMHGFDCAGPPAVHKSDLRYETAVFQCRNHTMTAINVGDYGVVYLTPNHMVDFSQGEAVVSFDMSTFRTSTRDWTDLWITPYDQNLALPLDSGLPDLSGEPRNTVNLRMEGGGGGTRFELNLVRNFVLQKIEQVTKGYEQVLTPDRARRDKFELRISRTHVKFGMPAYNLWWIDMNIADLGWDKAVVQLGHHSYTPEKSQDCTQEQLDAATCGPNTWHWDNVAINPSIPFSIIKADRRYVDKNNLITPVFFTLPAPVNSNLRFSAVGKIEVSFNDGATWQSARRQPSIESQDGGTPAHPEHFSSYWMPIPTGVLSVMFRGGPDGVYNGAWFVRDISIFSQAISGSGPISSPVPTATPASVSTPVPSPTIVATPTPTPAPPAFPASFNLLTPSNNATNVSTNPTFDWGDSSGATTYWVYVAPANAASWSWTKNVNTSDASWNNGSGWVQVTTTSLAVPTALANGTYKWWVVARNASGDTWAMSSAFTFTVGTITPTPTPTASATPKPSATPLASVAPSPAPSPVPTGSVMKIYAAGQSARGKNPTMKLAINGTTKATYNVGGDALKGVFQEFTYTSKTKVTPDKVRVRFTNDYYRKSTGEDRNLRVDRIVIDGVTYQTEAANVESQGSWNQQTGCAKGFKLSEWLHCNGYFQYK